MKPVHPQPEKLVEVALSKAKALNEPKDLEALIERISQAKVVMLGEASHGTHEFYEWRRIISEWLIVKHGFNFIAVEGDWPACQQLDDYILHDGDVTSHPRQPEEPSARRVFDSFRRWPTWMWANTEVARLAEWMKTHNSRVPKDSQVGFHGLDVYSFFESIDAVVERVERLNPFLARRVRARYACFDPYNGNERAYMRGLADLKGCEDDVADTLQEILRFRLDGLSDREHILFDAQQNARVVKNAERYYRAMFHADEHSWNVRDEHMMETLQTLLTHYGPDSKCIVWAHNTHIGDHHATDMARGGMVTIGGLARERLGANQVALVGFGTHRGSVIASPAWEGPIKKMQVPAALPGSYDAAFHEVCEKLGAGQFSLIFDRLSRNGPLGELATQRAIGVVYDPAHERWGNYIPTWMAKRYDAFVFIDETRALDPLIQSFDRTEIPETWPMGQ